MNFSPATMAKGARFWMKFRRYNLGSRDTVCDYPYPKSADEHGTIGRAFYPNIPDPRKAKPKEGRQPGTEIHGEGWFEDPDQVEGLIRHSGGRLQFDPQEIVDKGILSVEKMAELGYTKVKPAPAGVKLAERKPTEVIPSFGRMSDEEIREWANKHELFLDARLGRQKLIDRAQEHAKKILGGE